MKNQKTIFIGGGNIAEAIFTKISDNEIVIIEHNESRLNYLSKKYTNVTLHRSLDYITNTNNLIILAVKPQNAKNTCLSLKTNIQKSSILSVMAGITTNSLQKWLGTDKIVRAMPNTPGTQNIGVTGIYFSNVIENTIRNQIITIFNKMGLTYIFDNENSINKITAVASSSPAYVFYFIECLIESAIKKFNFSEKDAKEITLQVIKGSLAMLEQNPDLSIATFRNNVTSKGGTTAAAINTLEKNNFKEIINEAEIACYNRAIEIGNSYK